MAFPRVTADQSQQPSRSPGGRTLLPALQSRRPAKEVRTSLEPHPPIDRGARGRAGERAAAAYLVRRGYRVIAQNQRTPAGEIDIVCRHRSQVVIVEVKARSGQTHGTGLEAVGPVKARRLRTAALWWLAERDLFPCRIRFDVVAVTLDRSGLPLGIEHVEDAIDGAL